MSILEDDLTSLLPVVLAVDDDEVTRLLLRRCFTNGNVAITTYASAEELFANADLHSPAVLLLDLGMPGVSGLELQDMLRDRQVSLPIVFLTGTADIATAVRAMRNGAVDFVEKPFNASDLLQRVRLAFSRYLMPSAHLGQRAGDLTDPMLNTLTTREREVYERMILGTTSKVIAAELGCSHRTVEIHRRRVMAKMCASSLADLVRRAFALGERS